MKIVSDGFNWKDTDLKNIFKFPVTAYRKENGFLALISYNKITGNLLVCSKSTNVGDFVNMIQQELGKLPDNKYKLLVSILRENNCTLVCECINKDMDPHIIEYNSNQLIVLDLVYNEWDYQKMPYQRVKIIANSLGMPYKKDEYTFKTWDDLYSFKKYQDKSYDVHHEGWVLEDSSGFMVKYKTNYYKFWKKVRSYLEKIINNKLNIEDIDTLKEDDKMKSVLRYAFDNYYSDMSLIDFRKEWENRFNG